MTGPGTSSTTTTTSPSPPPPNISQACAACKHQRRKCAPDCALALYFPPNAHKDFSNAHKLFGVRNIMNTVRKVDIPNRERAVKAMILEANIRARDPVGGCYRMVKDLEMRISQGEAELAFVLQQLAMFKAHAQVQNPNPNPSSMCEDGVLQNGTEGKVVQQGNYFVGESSSKVGESSTSNSKSTHQDDHVEPSAIVISSSTKSTHDHEEPSAIVISSTNKGNHDRVGPSAIIVCDDKSANQVAPSATIKSSSVNLLSEKETRVAVKKSSSPHPEDDTIVADTIVAMKKVCNPPITPKMEAPMMEALLSCAKQDNIEKSKMGDQSEERKPIIL